MVWFRDDDCYILQDEWGKNHAVICKIFTHSTGEIDYYECDVNGDVFELPSCLRLDAIKSVVEQIVKESVR